MARNIINLEHWRDRIATWTVLPGVVLLIIWGVSMYLRHSPRSFTIWDKIGLAGLAFLLIGFSLTKLTEHIEHAHNRHQRWLDGH